MNESVKMSVMVHLEQGMLIPVPLHPPPPSRMQNPISLTKFNGNVVLRNSALLSACRLRNCSNRHKPSRILRRDYQEQHLHNYQL